MALMCTNLANDLGHHLVVTIIVTHGDLFSQLAPWVRESAWSTVVAGTGYPSSYTLGSLHTGPVRRLTAKGRYVMDVAREIWMGNMGKLMGNMGNMDGKYGKINGKYGKIGGKYGKIGGKYGKIGGTYGKINEWEIWERWMGHMGKLVGNMGKLVGNMGKLMGHMGKLSMIAGMIYGGCWWFMYGFYEWFYLVKWWMMSGMLMVLVMVKMVVKSLWMIVNVGEFTNDSWWNLMF